MSLQTDDSKNYNRNKIMSCFRTSQIQFNQQVARKESTMMNQSNFIKNYNLKQRKKQHFAIYTLVMIASLISGFQHILEFYLITLYQYNIVTFTIYLTTTFKLICWVVSIQNLSPPLKQFKGLMLLLDPILVTQLSVSICMCSLLYASNGKRWFHFTLMVEIFIMNHLYAVNFRVMTSWCDWSKAQVIFYKIILAILCLFYVSFGIYLTGTNVQLTGGRDENIDNSFKQFIVLYIFIYLAFMFELLAKFSDFDGTAELKYHYIMVGVEEDKSQQDHREISLKAQIVLPKEGINKILSQNYFNQLNQI